MNNRKIGTIYEDKACEYLKGLGYIIIERNFRGKRGEIDIIARDNHTLVFVEVKYRTSNAKGFPEEAVTYAKQKTIMGVASYYLLKNGLHDKVNVRFDVIAMYFDESVNHIKNAFGGM